MKTILLSFISVWLVLFVNSQEKFIDIPADELNVPLKNGTKVYINKLNYFEYDQDTYFFDSTVVENNIIRLQIKEPSKQAIYTFSSKNEVPITYMALLQTRSLYTYMFCGNFYKSENIFLIDSKYSKTENEYLINFYKESTKNALDNALFKVNGEYKELTFEQAKSKIQKRKEKFVKDLAKNESKLSKNFVHFINTEIELSAINQLLNWYEETNEKKIMNEFNKQNKSLVHEELYNEFLNKRWNVNSIQYFRAVERVINYEISKKRGEFSTYHEDVKNKNDLVAQVVDKTSIDYQLDVD